MLLYRLVCNGKLCSENVKALPERIEIMQKREGRQGKEAAGTTRRQFVRGMVCAGATLGCGKLLSGCARLGQTDAAPAEEAPSTPTTSIPSGPPSYVLPSATGGLLPEADHRGRLPTGQGEVRIDGLGRLRFRAGEIETLRPDLFQPGHFSLFDILVHLQRAGDLDLVYHYDEALDTHVIERLNGQPDWWYQAHYASGWFESNVMRMDMYPYKDQTTLRLSPQSRFQVTSILDTFRQEVERRERHGGVILPEMEIDTNRGTWRSTEIEVRAHDLRVDLFQPGVITAMDVILSMVEQGDLENIRLTWYARIGSADPLDSYFLEGVNVVEAAGGCGLVYEIGPRAYTGFRGSHIHIPADARIIVSPEYAHWFWICLGRGGL